MSDSKKNTFFGGAAILMAGALVVKIIGACYQIPLTTILGKVGMGHFKNAYIIFTLMLTIATAGLPVALSKSISEANALGRQNQVKKIFRVSLSAFLVLGGIGFVVLFFGAGPLAELQGDSGAKLALQALAPCVLFVCASSAFRGYAQGHSDMVPTSVSQVIEAVLKLVVGLGFATFLMSRTFATETLRLEVGAAGGIIGVTSGALLALVYLIFHQHRGRVKTRQAATDRPDSSGVILKNLIKIAVPITLGASVASIISVIDANLVQNQLQNALKLSEITAVGLYGTYQSAVTLYSFPSYFMVPFTAAVIPAVSAALARHDHREGGRISESALRVASLIALPMGIGLSALATPIMTLLYLKSDLDMAIAGPLLAVLGVASIFVCITLMCNSIMQAHGFVNLPIVTAVVGGVVKLVVNYTLVGNPNIGIHGAPIGTLCCYLVMAVLDIVIILRVIPSPPSFFRAFAKPLVASLAMGAAAWAVCSLLTKLGFGMLATIGGIGVGVVVYLILVVVLRVFAKEDLELMPKGDKIAKILRL